MWKPSSYSGEVGSRGKNIELQYHYILDMIQKEELHVNYIPKKEYSLIF